MIGWLIAGAIAGALLQRWLMMARLTPKQPDRSFRHKVTGVIWQLENVARDPTRTDTWVYVTSALESVTSERISREAWEKERLFSAFDEVYFRNGEWHAKVRLNPAAFQ